MDSKMGMGRKVIHLITPTSFDPIIHTNFLQDKAWKFLTTSVKIRINVVINITIVVDMGKCISQNERWKSAFRNVPTSTKTLL